jgi:hypothetical protein
MIKETHTLKTKKNTQSQNKTASRMHTHNTKIHKSAYTAKG